MVELSLILNQLETYDPEVLRVRRRDRDDYHVSYIFRVNWVEYDRVVAEGDTGEYVLSAGDTTVPYFEQTQSTDGAVASGWVECVEVDDKRDELLWKTGPKPKDNDVAEVMSIATTQS